MLIHNGTLQNITIQHGTFQNSILQNGTLQNGYFKTVNRYKPVRDSERYIIKWYSYKTVHVTKRYSVAKWYITKRYIIITVQYYNGLVEH
jgi:hypothetical protein